MRRGCFPGHEYLVRNLEFTLDREPDNQEATELLAHVRSTAADAAPVTTLGQEKRVNTFFRLSNPRIIARLQEQFPELGATPDPQAVFLKLRELRNAW